MRTELANDCYSSNDGNELIYYNQQGQVHREDGPAQIWYNEDGSIKFRSYYLYDKRIAKTRLNDQRFVTQLHLQYIG